MIKFLLGKASTGKFRTACVEWIETWNEEKKGFVITRKYGQLHGKITEAPEIVITVGKAGRTHREQATLKFNSLVKEYLDKGYKELEKPAEEYSEEELNEIYGDVKTRGEGIIKPMLAKQADKVAKKTFDKVYYASRKINGVRCLIYYKEGEIRTASRGATDYDLALYHILHNNTLKEFFTNHPNVILDGEIYKHGLTLNKISGICRTQATVDDGKELQFYWYDIVELDKPFTERMKLIYEYSKEMNLPDFNPYRENSDNELAIQVVPHVRISGYDNMKKLHDEYVSNGWEGLVIRLAESVYKPGSRGSDWIKIKVYFEAEYLIVGLSEGLREEDMCFILQTPNGQEFKCKPMGNREQKQWYREHIDELIGEMLTIKYFEMSGVEGSEVPQQPIGIIIRNYE